MSLGDDWWDEQTEESSEDDESLDKAALMRENAQMEYSEGNLEASLELYEEIVESCPPEPVDYFWIGYLQYKLHEPQKGIVGFTQGIRMIENGDSGDMLDPLMTPEAVATFYGNRGYCYLDAGRLDEAIIDSTRALDLDPTRSMSLNCRAAAYTAMLLFSKALVDNNLLIALQGNGDAYYRRSSTFFQMGRLNLALRDVDLSLKMDSSDDVAFLSRGYLRMIFKQYDLAIEDMSRALVIRGKSASVSADTVKENSTVHWRRAFCFCVVGRFADARSDLELSHDLSDLCGLRGALWKVGHLADSFLTFLPQFGKTAAAEELKAILQETMRIEEFDFLGSFGLSYCHACVIIDQRVLECFASLLV